jgi:protein-S-isoprenylcysteine O-methyltransferase Ste14
MPGEKDHANVLIPPPVALALCIGAGWLLKRVWPAPFLPDGLPHRTIGYAIVALSVAIGIGGLIQFGRARTSVRPDRPTSAIIEAGPYRYSRNPLYLSMLILVAGLALALDSLWQFGALAALYLVLRWGVVAREEAYLTRKFGAPYIDYVRRVRRWL